MAYETASYGEESIDQDDIEVFNNTSLTEARERVLWANTTGNTEARYTAAAILWALIYEKETILDPGLILCAANRCMGGVCDSDPLDSFNDGLHGESIDERLAKQIVYDVANSITHGDWLYLFEDEQICHHDLVDHGGSLRPRVFGAAILTLLGPEGVTEMEDAYPKRQREEDDNSISNPGAMMISFIG